ncbi:MAG: FAD:protein FMN transferase [Rhodothermales bacterium]
MFLLVLSIASCVGAEEGQTYTFSRFAMDTVVEYTIIAPSQDEARRAMMKAQEEIERVERLLWEGDSLSHISAFNRARGRVEIPEEVDHFLRRAHEYYVISNGAFDITIKPVLDLYDFDADAPAPPPDSVLRERLHLVGTDRIRFEHPATLEKPLTDAVEVAVGGVAKGYAVDRAVHVLKAQGIEHALVNAGGDLYCLGTNHGKPWAIGIRDPDDPSAIIDVLHVSDRAVATSGDYQRFFVYEGQRYHHLLHPKNGKPVRATRSATVTAPTTEQADALATAVFIAGREKGIALLDSLPGIEGMLIDSSGTVVTSQQFRTAAMQQPVP